MSRIIAVDLDGTLLSSENKVTKYTKDIINLLVKNNFYFVLASGRHYIDVIKIKESLNIEAFMITSNGAKIYNLKNKLIFHNNLDLDISSQLCKMKYLNKDIITHVYKNNQWYINNNKIDNKFNTFFSSLKSTYFHPDNFIFNNISKIFFTSNNISKLYVLEKKNYS